MIGMTRFGFLARRTLFGATVGGAVLFMVFGVIIWGGFNWTLEVTNTKEFCISCHEMKDNVYAEYQGSIHDANRSGVRAGCPDCHVPRPWIHKIVRKIKASNEIFHKLMGTVNTPEKFNEHRLEMAQRVWSAMKSTDSRECRNCHDFDTMDPAHQKPRARNQHLFAMEKGNTCIDCHKGIAHKPAHKNLPDEELERLAQPNPDYIRPIPESFKAGMERAKAADAKAEADAAKTAVAAAPAAPAANSAGAATGGLGVDWSKAPARQITIFYPGQASMEWTLVGSMHGGARPFKAGDRCFTCHDKETADMGRKIVSGEKAEPTPIPGKRGSIPVAVQAAHDADNLYLRFQWEATAHTPVPFVEGGKMDPAHSVKLAFMLATDAPQYADRAGCWGTCHHDLRSMPEAPKDATLAGLDLAKGVTKYIKESRTAVEEAGRMGAKLGGWDKLKDAGALAESLKAGHYMDLVRVKSDGSVEDGQVLEQRVMTGGQGVQASIAEAGGRWTVEIKRPLKPGKSGDVGIEPGVLYNFGFAIHDDYTDARFHHVSLGYKLGLDNDQAEINAKGR